MIIGIGTDITAISRIAKILEARGEQFVSRCFSAGERAKVEGAAKDNAPLLAAGYAKRWAAKEACAKALGLGIRDEIFLKDIEVFNDSQGKPSLNLTGGAKDRLTALTPKGMTSHIHVSLSDEADAALAFVVISAEQMEQGR